MSQDAALFGGRAQLVDRYIDILSSAGIAWGLLGPREAGRVWERHILNCVAIESLVPAGSDVADVGSGAGLPGIPLALLRPDLRVTLIEPLLRRANFLTMVVDELRLSPQVQVRRARADQVEDQFDVVTARALAPMPRLLGWCLPLMRPDGQVLALKGRSAQAEIEQVQALLRRQRLVAEMLSLAATSESELATIVRVAPQKAGHPPVI